MFREIISKPETGYLGFGIMMPCENKCTDVEERYKKYDELCNEI